MAGWNARATHPASAPQPSGAAGLIEVELGDGLGERVAVLVLHIHDESLGELRPDHPRLVVPGSKFECGRLENRRPRIHRPTITGEQNGRRQDGV